MKQPRIGHFIGAMLAIVLLLMGSNCTPTLPSPSTPTPPSPLWEEVAPCPGNAELASGPLRYNLCHPVIRTPGGVDPD